MEIRENLSKIQQEICQAAIAAGRDPKEITLIAVSKTKPIEMVAEAAALGMLDFGENRPQELAEKAEIFPHLRWHQIGQLQKNKVKHIIAKACLIHSVDSLSLCQEIEKRAAAINKVQDILIQVNISGEATKSGIRPDEAAELCREISKLPHVRVRGLMTISVPGMSEEENFALFTDLRRLAESLQGLGIPNVSMEELSMGMTHDFVPAIRAGATMVRVGTGIFGSRKSCSKKYIAGDSGGMERRMSNLMAKMLSLVGFDTENGYEEEYYQPEADYEDTGYDESPALERFASRRSSRVVKLHETSSQQMRVVVIQPKSFDEAQDIADHLKERKPVIMNLEAVDTAVSRKIVDFLSGATYALDGNIQKITNGIFLVAPNNVGILDEEITGKGAFPWGN